MATKRHRVRTRWDAPVTCLEVALAMYRAGQPRHEVRWRLERMGRWSASTIHDKTYEAECDLALMFPHGNRREVRAWREAAE